MPEKFSCQITFRGGAATFNVLFILSSDDMTIMVITTCFFFISRFLEDGEN